MPDPLVHADLVALLETPRERLDVEIKGWLDLCTSEHKAVFAKAVVALANTGGGFVIIGQSEVSGVYDEAPGRPVDLADYRDDIINGIVRAYAAPPFQVTTYRVSAPSGLDYPIIQVPGGHRSPVQANKGSPDQRSLINGRVYIRRTGPESAEPGSPEEWRDLFARWPTSQEKVSSAISCSLPARFSTTGRSCLSVAAILLSKIDVWDSSRHTK